MMQASSSIVWFRHDLRLEDQPALAAACLASGAVLPLYIWAPEEDGAWAPGAASRWWLHHSLQDLDRALREKGSRLILRRGPSLAVIRELAAVSGARAIFWNEGHEPSARARDERLREALEQEGLNLSTFNGRYLHLPETLRTQGGRPFQVFTPFYKKLLSDLANPAIRRTPGTIPAPKKWPASLELKDLDLLPKTDWAAGLRAAWQPGESGAQKALETFVRKPLSAYPQARDVPSEAGTSRLSPHLHFGEIGPWQVWRAIQKEKSAPASARESFLRQLGWREFGVHLLHHFPRTPAEPLRASFLRFPWRRDERSLDAWRNGQTGYPLVDAGLRELWATGWMHNRVRMIAASFLVKDLLLPWQEGARWFWETLVDADLANNTLGWQWSAGCGADAAPYFRIMNPSAQSEKFDPAGAYIRRWIPELAGAPVESLHHPEQHPWPGTPPPLVEHADARKRALSAFQTLRSS